MTTVYSTDKLRNVVLLGHGSSGKTSLAEAMLFNAGAINRMGKVEEGTTVSDFDEEEIRRHISLNLSLVPCEWEEHKSTHFIRFATYMSNRRLSIICNVRIEAIKELVRTFALGMYCNNQFNVIC